MLSPIRSLCTFIVIIVVPLFFIPSNVPAQQKVTDSAIKIHHQQITDLTNTAHKYEKSGDKKTALLYHKFALQKSKQFQLPEREARALVNIAKILKESESSKSLEYLNSALGIARSMNNKELESDIYLAMTDIYRQQENYAEALHALEEHHRLLDSLLAQKKNQEIERIRSSDEINFEHTLIKAIIISVVLIGFIFGYFFIKTKKLNTALKHSNLVKDTLFSILAHDLKGPAGSITQCLLLIESGEISEDDQKELLGMLKKQSDAFLDILNSLLEWAQCQLKGIEVKPHRFDAKMIISKNIRMLAGLCANKQIQIEDNTTDELYLFADDHHFDIIIRNLLSNAIKFSHLGGIIRIGSQEKGDKIIFSIRDEGIGISPAKQLQFNTAGIEVSFGTKGEKGTGLGLLLTKEFVKASGDTVWLTSEEGKGTTFYFSMKKDHVS